MMAPSPAEQRSRRVAAAGALLPGLGLLVFALLCWRLTVAVPGGADSSGYFNLAHDLSAGRIVQAVADLPEIGPAGRPAFAHVPLGYVPTADGRALSPSYPLGMPLLFAGAASVLGWETGPRLVLVLHAVAGVLLTWLAARQAGGGRVVAAFAAAALAASPLYLLFSLQAMSDVPALTWSLAALWLAGRRTLGGAAAAGLATGMAVLVRPTNALVLLPVVVALGWSPRRLLALALGGLPALAGLLLFNRAVYGSPWLTGYGAIGALFSWQWVGGSLAHYARWLPLLLSPLALLAVAAPWAARAPVRARLMHGSWALLGLGFYAAYYHTHEAWWYLRFVLPVLPSVAILAGLVAESALERRTTGPRLLGIAAAALVLAGTAIHQNSQLRPWEIVRGERLYLDAVRLARQHVPAGSVVVAMQASGALHHALPHVLVRWDTLDGQWPRFAAAAARAGLPVHAVLFPFEEEPALRRETPGEWRLVARAGDIAVWRLEPTGGVP
jgi:hypothetical protein